MSTRKKPMRSFASPTRKAVPRCPDLVPIIDALLDAYAVVCTASKVLDSRQGADETDFAITALHQGVEALERAIDRLDDIEAEIS